MRMRLIVALFLPLLLWAKSAVWEVKGGEGRLFLAGTVHLAEANATLPESLIKAYEQSTELVFETDMAAMEEPAFARQIAQRMMLPEGQSLESRLAPSTIALIRRFAEDEKVPYEHLSRMTPQMLSLTIAVAQYYKLGINAEGIDSRLFTRATTDKKEISWLESPKVQLEFLVRMGRDDEDALVRQTLADLKDASTEIPQLYSAWKKGDLNAIDRVALDSMRQDYPAIYDDLIISRNESWIPAIVHLTEEPGTKLVLVGVAHLAGPDGLVERLSAQGYTLKQLP